MTVNLFNADIYRAANFDLASFSDTEALSHFQTYGLNQGRTFSLFIDINFYRASNLDLADLSNHQLFDHLQNYGIQEGRRFSPFVNLNIYQAANPDLSALGFDNKQLLSHLATYGVGEGRRFSVSFDSNYYRNANSDLASLNNLQLLNHFQLYGLAEGRASSESFNVQYYLAINSDLRTLGFNYQQAQQHFEIYGFREGRWASQSELNLPTNPSSTLNTSFNLGIVRNNRTIRESLGSADPNDCYRFTLSNLSNFNLVLDSMSPDAGVELLNSNGSLIVRSNNSGSTSKSISWILGADTYYIQIYSHDGADINYNLSVFATPVVSNSFNSDYGYGLVNAAAAVAYAIGQTSSLRDVPNISGNDWGLDMVNAPEVWAQGYTGQDIVVAVVDSGVDYNHSDLDANIWRNNREIADNGIDDDGNGYVDDIRGWDFVDGDSNPMDLNGHGTHLAGTIAAENNGIGTTGVAYSAKIMPVRVVDSSGKGSLANMAAGIRYAADNSADVINLSLAGRAYSSDTELAIRYATTRGAVVVMAAGNQGNTQPAYPALYAKQWGIAVGAVNSNNQIASFSNLAGNIVLDYVVAPGVNVYSTYLDNTYQFLSGTSMATPYVSGVIALMLSANCHLNLAQVESYLVATANPLIE